jgi:hypothetical protein
MGRVITIVTVGVCLVASRAQASPAGATQPDPVRPVVAEVAAEHPIPIPRIKPVEPGPVPMPHVSPAEPGPVPMPHLLDPDVEERLLVPIPLRRK